MKVVIDIEANGLVNPTKVWVIVCKDADTGENYVFRRVSDDQAAKEAFLEFSRKVDCWIGHNWLEYDYPVLNALVGLHISDVAAHSIDTLILSRLIDYPRDGHSIESYGLQFGLEKGEFSDWSKYSLEMEEYCVRDVEICHRIYLLYKRYLSNADHKRSIELEHRFQLIINDLHDNGFGFNSNKAEKLLEKVEKELAELDKEILNVFPPRLKLIREITPKLTQHGTLHRGDFRWAKDGDLSEYNGGAFCRCSWQEFNPSSHKQIVDVLHQAGWKPVDRTQTAIDTRREIGKLKRSKDEDLTLDIKLKELYDKEQSQEKYGWKINELNLSTLPPNAPKPARTIARRILLEARRRTLVEWTDLCESDGRIRGKFVGIGAWTHRMAHQKPNTANIPTGKKLYASEMRSLWQAPKNRLLVGVDADAIQFRVAACYINDPLLIKKIVEGKKSDGTDPHSHNKKIIGETCKSRDASKRFLFSLILGGGVPKLSQILSSSLDEAEDARDKLYKEYPGLVELKNRIVVSDAKRGWFVGFDGRRVKIPGDTFSERKHLCPSGYLQNGEAVIMKHAAVLWHDELKTEGLLDWYLVNFVHDEWQTECPNDMGVALHIAKVQAESLRKVGEELGLKCPLAGSYWNDDLHDYTIGTNWKVTH